MALPGFVDAHTHALFAGEREDEWEERLRGVSYQAIAARGGGIRASVRRLREASREALVQEAVEMGQDRGIDITLCAERPLAGAQFSFSFETFSREHAPGVRGLFEPAPKGVTFEDLAIEEEVHPEDKGVEAYAPVHDYALRGEGTACGSDAVCTIGLVCNEGLDPPACVPVGSAGDGDPCSADADCAVGLKCHFGTQPPACVVDDGTSSGEPCDG